MEDKIIELREKYCRAKTEKEKKAIDKEMKALFEQNGDVAAEAMIKAAEDTAIRAEALAIKAKMSEILPAISLSFIAKAYFNKSRQWINQRLNGSVVNGKPVTFTSEELETLRFALSDLGKKLGSMSVIL
jgi:hypothetical protein